MWMSRLLWLLLKSDVANISVKRQLHPLDFAVAAVVAQFAIRNLDWQTVEEDCMWFHILTDIS